MLSLLQISNETFPKYRDKMIDALNELNMVSYALNVATINIKVVLTTICLVNTIPNTDFF